MLDLDEFLIKKLAKEKGDSVLKKVMELSPTFGQQVAVGLVPAIRGGPCACHEG